jgi:hypothetical protein
MVVELAQRRGLDVLARHATPGDAGYERILARARFLVTRRSLT